MELTVRALDHIGFSVSDLDRSSEWYTRLLGAGPFARKAVGPGYVGEIIGYPECRMEWALWRLPQGTVLELIQYVVPEPVAVAMETNCVGNGHLCLVMADIDGVYERLRGHAEFRSPAPVEIPHGPWKGARVCYTRDPDGISVELMESPPGDWSLADQPDHPA
jgi:catechol 2,3-dioxygenase-like lactoylglutathione lyase family enzyme